VHALKPCVLTLLLAAIMLCPAPLPVCSARQRWPLRTTCLHMRVAPVCVRMCSPPMQALSVRRCCVEAGSQLLHCGLSPQRLQPVPLRCAHAQTHSTRHPCMPSLPDLLHAACAAVLGQLGQGCRSRPPAARAAGFIQAQDPPRLCALDTPGGTLYGASSLEEERDYGAHALCPASRVLPYAPYPTLYPMRGCGHAAY